MEWISVMLQSPWVIPLGCPQREFVPYTTKQEKWRAIFKIMYSNDPLFFFKYFKIRNRLIYYLSMFASFSKIKTCFLLSKNIGFSKEQSEGFENITHGGSFYLLNKPQRKYLDIFRRFFFLIRMLLDSLSISRVCQFWIIIIHHNTIDSQNEILFKESFILIPLSHE